jgi:UDP-glucuronate 4-epimerase
MKKVLVTGTAGFIGFHLALKLVQEGYAVVGLDNINDYYDPALKWARLAESGIDQEQVEQGGLVQSTKFPGYRFIKADLQDQQQLMELFQSERFQFVVNLAAQAGVRYSLTNPRAYTDSNIIGFLNVLEACRAFPVEHLLYASSSSVYGLNKEIPFATHQHTDHPISLYAASKKSNELMAHTYSQLFGIPTTGLRFFTVYGPWGRPDMALFIFTKAILEGQPFEVFNEGHMSRDFTYVADIVESLFRLLPKAPMANPSYNHLQPNPAASSAPYRVFNIGNNNPVALLEFIQAIEEHTRLKGKMVLKPLQMGDVPRTWADVTDLGDLIDFKPQTSVLEGIKRFLVWYEEFYHSR